ncbi:MAG: RNA methyltransferase [Saprospiraceae bacterium]|nr:MAG: RNA methyltransferase [Saprospiraceae bacterium]
MKLHRPLVLGVADALREIFQENKYTGKVIERLLKSNTKWGSRDRTFVAENVYDMVRWWRLLLAVDGRQWAGDGGRETSGCFDEKSLFRLIGVNLILKKVELPDWEEFEGLDPKEIFEKRKSLETGRAVIQSIPDWLDETAAAGLGAAWDAEISALNETAPVVLRTNTLKITKEELQKQLAEAGWESAEIELAPDALVLAGRGNIFQSPLFKKGLFEVQDAGSQCIAPFVMAEPGMRVIDACAGAGGKALHLATLMQNKGSIIALDTETWKLKELHRRASRNGIDIVQGRPIVSTKVIKRLRNSAGRLLLDVPCSGLGVLRRNPDAKWKLSPEFLEQVRTTQAFILQRYSTMLKPGGSMVYATCSILPSENERQVETFLRNNTNFKLVEERKISPARDGFDGFYMARLERAV